MTHIIYLSIIAILLLKIFKQGVRINGYEDEENSREIEDALKKNIQAEKQVKKYKMRLEKICLSDGEYYIRDNETGTKKYYIEEHWKETRKKKGLDKHPWINGDPCRCEECTEKYQSELLKDLQK